MSEEESAKVQGDIDAMTSLITQELVASVWGSGAISTVGRREKLLWFAMLAKGLGFDPWVSDPGRFWLLKPGLPDDEAAAVREAIWQEAKP